MRIRDLSGKQFGSLTVLQLYPERSRTGQTRWLCRCLCGREVIVQSGNLLSGQKSCGQRCPYRPRRHDLDYLREIHLVRYKKTEVIRDEEGTWYAPRKSRKYIGESKPTLLAWKDDCPYRDGKGILTKEFVDESGVATEYFFKPHLDEIRRAKKDLQRIPKCPGHTYLPAASKDLGVSEKIVRKALRACGMQMKNVRCKRLCRSKKTGKLRVYSCERPYVPDDFIADYKKGRTSAVPDGKKTVKQAAAFLGCKRYEINNLIKSGLLAADDCELMVASKKRKDGSPAHGRRGCKLVDRKAIEKLKDALSRMPTDFVGLKNRSGPHGGLLRRAAEWLKTEQPNGNGHRDPVSSPEPAPKRRGRKRSPVVMEIMLFCYEQLSSGTKRRAICKMVREHFERIMDGPDVTKYARRYAKSAGKPWPV